MKKPKTYRLSQSTLDAIENIKQEKPTWTETEIIEEAIKDLNRKISMEGYNPT